MPTPMPTPLTITVPAVSTRPTPPSLSSSKNSGGSRSPLPPPLPPEPEPDPVPEPDPWPCPSPDPLLSSSCCGGGGLRQGTGAWAGIGGEDSSITRCTPSPHVCPSVSHVSEQLSSTSRNSGSFCRIPKEIKRGEKTEKKHTAMSNDGHQCGHVVP